MKKISFRNIIAVILSCLILAGVLICPGEICFATGKKIARSILVFYSGKNGEKDISNNVSELFGISFGYLGYDVRYQDLDKGLGDIDDLDRADIYMVCQFEAVHPNGDELCRFLLSKIPEKRVVLLELPGSEAYQNELFAKIGFQTEGLFIKNDDVSDFWCDESVGKGEAEFRKPDTFPYFDIQANPASGDFKVLVKARRDTSEIVLAGTTPRGAVAFINKLIFTDGASTRKWMVDPVKLTQSLLGGEKFIVPDPCVKSGNRVAFIHIDGDGFNYRSSVGANKYCGEIIFDEVIDRYKLPTAASLIVAEINARNFGNAELEKICRSLFKSPYVSLGSHSWYHPFNWEKIKADVPEKYSDDTHEDLLQDDLKAFNPAWVVYETCLQKEIPASVEFLSRLTGKTCETFFWTGKCNPTTAAIEMCEKLNILNVNGGDTRYDDEVGISTRAALVTPVRVEFHYTIVRRPDGAVAADGLTVHAVTDKTGRPRRLPAAIRSLFP